MLVPTPIVSHCPSYHNVGLWKRKSVTKFNVTNIYVTSGVHTLSIIDKDTYICPDVTHWRLFSKWWVVSTSTWMEDGGRSLMTWMSSGPGGFSVSLYNWDIKNLLAIYNKSFIVNILLSNSNSVAAKCVFPRLPAQPMKEFCWIILHLNHHHHADTTRHSVNNWILQRISEFWI